MDETQRVLLAALAVLLTAYATYVIRREFRSGNLASPLALYSALMIVHFAMPGAGIAASEEMLFANPENLQYAVEALALVMLTYAAFHLGCAISVRNDRATVHREQTIYSWNDSRVYLVIGAFLVVGWLIRIYIIAQDGYFQLQRV